MQGLLTLLRSIGPARIAAMGVVAAILIGFFAFIVTRLSAMPMAPLYSDLSLEDSSRIVSELEAAGVGYELRNGGATIMAPQDSVLRLRMQLASEGLPTGGSIGYEIFDQTSTLGATSFVQNINHLRALEGELARSIRTIDRVSNARVHLVIPERQLFQRDIAQPSASIVLSVRGGIDPGQIRAVQHLVASAVEGLRPERVSIVDETGRLLASGVETGDTLLTAGLDERTSAFENRIANQIDGIVSSIVGPGRTRVKVSAEFDLNRVTETRDTFDPESQVVRSQQTRSEESKTATEQSAAVSVGNGLPGNEVADPNAGADTTANSDETINYEISRVTRTEVIEPGSLKKLSVAVLVDGVYTPDNAGAYQYAPRPQEEIDRITALVRSAIGFDESRGDKVEVVNLRFAEAPQFDAVPTEEAGGFSLGKEDYFYLAELVLAVIVGFILIFMVVRPLIRRIVTPEGEALALAAANGGAVAALPAPGATPQLTDQRAGAGAGAPPVLAPSSETSSQIERAKLSGSLHADTIGKVGQLAKDNPADSVAMVRSWLAEPA